MDRLRETITAGDGQRQPWMGDAVRSLALAYGLFVVAVKREMSVGVRGCGSAGGGVGEAPVNLLGVAGHGLTPRPPLLAAKCADQERGSHTTAKRVRQSRAA